MEKGLSKNTNFGTISKETESLLHNFYKTQNLSFKLIGYILFLVTYEMSYLSILDVLVVKQHSQIWMTSQNCIRLKQCSPVFIYLHVSKYGLVCWKAKVLRLFGIIFIISKKARMK